MPRRILKAHVGTIRLWLCTSIIDHGREKRVGDAVCISEALLVGDT
jgi:hypothetical protein